jgi:ribosomal protein L24
VLHHKGDYGEVISVVHSRRLVNIKHKPWCSTEVPNVRLSYSVIIEGITVRKIIW